MRGENGTPVHADGRSPLQLTGLITGPCVAVLLLVFFDPDPERPAVASMAAVAILMAIWWITEAVPLPATSLLPFVLFPLMGILPPGGVADSYINPIIFLFLGGFLIALAMERWNLHRRMALGIIASVGSNPRSMVLGFMIASGFLSMWISNTATAVMMLPIGLAIIIKVEETFGHERSHGLTLALLLGIAYGCSIGGVATLVGTPPNLVLARVYEGAFPEATPISFGQWILFGLPFSVIMLIVTWFLLTRVLCRLDQTMQLETGAVQKERAELGPMRYEEKAVAVIFAVTAFLWIFRTDIELGVATVPGWSRLWEPLQALHDGTVAIAMAVLLFLIPSRGGVRAGALLDAQVFGRVPWGIILLFGGGFALADGFVSSGLSVWLGERFTAYEGIHPLVAIVAVSTGVNLLTELTSNTATTQMLLPLLASMAGGLGFHPLLLMVVATVSASMAFMMPVATPPNAIIFGSRRIRIAEMVRVGLLVNLCGLVLVIIVSWFYLPFVFDLNMVFLSE